MLYVQNNVEMYESFDTYTSCISFDIFFGLVLQDIQNAGFSRSGQANSSSTFQVSVQAPHICALILLAGLRQAEIAQQSFLTLWQACHNFASIRR